MIVGTALGLLQAWTIKNWKLKPIVERIQLLMKSFCFCACLHTCKEDTAPTHILGQLPVTSKITFNGEVVNRNLVDCPELEHKFFLIQSVLYM